MCNIFSLNPLFALLFRSLCLKSSYITCWNMRCLLSGSYNMVKRWKCSENLKCWICWTKWKNLPISTWGPSNSFFWAFSGLSHIIWTWQLAQHYSACDIWALKTKRPKKESKKRIQRKNSSLSKCIFSMFHTV